MFFTNFFFISLSLEPLQNPSTSLFTEKKKRYTFECQNNCNKLTYLEKDASGKRLNKVKF